MNNLNKIWDELSHKQVIFTKHNCIDVYNSQDTKLNLYNKAKSNYLEQEKLTETQADLLYSVSSTGDKKLIDNEINLILKCLDEYKLFKSNIARVNKYKSKAFELLTKEVYNKLFIELNGEENFNTILNNINEKIKQNPYDYLSTTQEFKIFDFEKNKKQLKQFQFQKYNLNICFAKKEPTGCLFHFMDSDTIPKKLIEDKKIYLFEMTNKTPVLRLKRNKNMFFYSTDGEIKYKITNSFDEVVKMEYIYPELKILNKFYIKSTFKEFLQDYYVKSDFLASLETINKSHSHFKISSVVKEYNYKKRPDLWRLENGELIFFEMKFNEFTELNLKDITNTIFYINEFNTICEKNNLDIKVKNVNIIHINNIISNKIKKYIEKEKNLNINLINLKDLINKVELEVPSKIIILKEKSKTIRKIETSLNPNNIILDLTNVT